MIDAFKEFIGLVGYAIEALGVLVILLGCLISSGRFLWQLRAKAFEVVYRDYRHALARSIILGLEFLIAGDIIRTVTVSPTLTSVVVLAGIVLIRTFLSLTLEMSVEGRLPWKASTIEKPPRSA